MMTRFNGFSVDGSILDNDYYSVAGHMTYLEGVWMGCDRVVLVLLLRRKDNLSNFMSKR